MAQIMDKCLIIQLLIPQYPIFLEEWEKEKDNEFKETAEIFAEGDGLVEYSVYSNLCIAFDNNHSYKDYYYQSMMVLTYSYYENMLHLLSNSSKVKCKATVESICKMNNITMSKGLLNGVDFVELASAVRNNIVHNYSSERNKHKLSCISKQYDDLHYHNGVISFSGSKFILDSLEKEYNILIELATNLGYANNNQRPDNQSV